MLIPQQKSPANLIFFLCFLGCLLNLPTASAEELEPQFQAAEYFRLGRISQAIQIWRNTATYYRQQQQPQQLGEILIDLAQAYNQLGQIEPAESYLTEFFQLNLENPALMGRAYQILGDTHYLKADYPAAISAYQNSLQYSEEGIAKIQIINDLVRLLERQSKTYAYQATITEANYDYLATEKLLNLANSTYQQAQKLARSAWQQIQLDSDNLTKLEAWVNWSRIVPPNSGQSTHFNTHLTAQDILQIIAQTQPAQRQIFLLIEASRVIDNNQSKLIEAAIEIAKNISDYRGLSFSLLELANWKLEQQDYSSALALAQQAQQAAQNNFDDDSLAISSRLIGKIYNHLQQQELAQQAYLTAISSWQKIQQQLIGSKPEIIFNFQEQNEATYRELLGLLLSSQKPENLSLALEIADLLQISQIQNYFGDRCVEFQKINYQELLQQSNSAIIRSFVFPENLQTILVLPNGNLRHYSVAIDSQTLGEKIETWYRLLNNINSREYLQLSQELYQIIIQPLAADLQVINPQTLIFIHDGKLRNIPMSALHDRQKFLLENYSLTNLLGLNFIHTNSQQNQPRAKKGLQLLAFGISTPDPNYLPLPNVQQEIDSISQYLPGQTFLNQEFTSQSLEKTVNNSTKDLVLHFATHGKFNGLKDDSNILAWDTTISLTKLEAIIQGRSNIELIFFSACRTAVGNKLSILGLAGIGLRSGASSTIGSLWTVNDASIAQISRDFYYFWQEKGFPLAEALRQAQLQQIKDQRSPHPSEWASLILVGNWQ